MAINSNFKRKKDFAVISMADIVLLLLIFFLLTSAYVIQPGLRVRLPRATTKEALSENRINVTITREGAIFLENKPVSLEELMYTVKGAKNKIILIRADRNVTIDMTVKVMDALKKAGAEKFVIATTPGE